MIISDSLGNAILDLILGGVALAAQANVYIGYVTSEPGEDGSGYAEPAGGGYARVTKTNNPTNFPAATLKTKSNGTTIEFPEATAAHGTVLGVAVFHQLSGGDAKLYAPLDESKAVGTGDKLSFTVGQLEFQLVGVVEA